MAIILAIFCGGCSKTEQDPDQFIEVMSDIPGVSLQIPEGALPRDTELSEVTLREVDPVNWRIPDAEITVIDLAPDGLVFEDPAWLRVPLGDTIPIFFHLSQGEVTPVSGVEYHLTANGSYARVPVEHFSEMSIVRHEAFQAKAEVHNTYIGENIRSRLRISIASEYLLPESDITSVPTPGTSEIRAGFGLAVYEMDYIKPSDNPVVTVETFESEVDIENSGWKCVGKGPNAIRVGVLITWKETWLQVGQTLESEDLYLTDGFESFDLFLYFHCMERLVKPLLEELNIQTYASWWPPRRGNDFGQQELASYDDKFLWTALDSGGNRQWTTSTFGDSQKHEQAMAWSDDLHIQHTSTVTNTWSSAGIWVSKTRKPGSILVSGQINASAKEESDGAHALTKVFWLWQIAAQRPLRVRITGCDLFVEAAFADQDGYSKSGDICSFRFGSADENVDALTEIVFFKVELEADEDEPNPGSHSFEIHISDES